MFKRLKRRESILLFCIFPREGYDRSSLANAFDLTYFHGRAFDTIPEINSHHKYDWLITPSNYITCPEAKYPNKNADLDVLIGYTDGAIIWEIGQRSNGNEM